MSTTDRNYTGEEQSGFDAKAERVGDIAGEPPTNETTDRGKASKLANLLEGLEFPATKEEILNHLNQRSPATGNRVNDVFEAVRNNLDDGREYKSVYDVEVAADLVERIDTEKPYVRDRALNKANRRRIGESSRPEPYSGRENIMPANSRDVSPNTPRGEDV
jgi:hypothetical protein